MEEMWLGAISAETLALTFCTNCTNLVFSAGAKTLPMGFALAPEVGCRDTRTAKGKGICTKTGILGLIVQIDIVGEFGDKDLFLGFKDVPLGVEGAAADREFLADQVGELRDREFIIVVGKDLQDIIQFATGWSAATLAQLGWVQGALEAEQGVFPAEDDGVDGFMVAQDKVSGKAEFLPVWGKGDDAVEVTAEDTAAGQAVQRIFVDA